MNFFQLQNQLFYQRKDKAEELDTESSAAFVPFLISRWLSFYGRDQAAFTNMTLNRFGYIFGDDKNKQYKLFYNLIPRMRFKKLQYIKKKKKDEEKQDSDELVRTFARGHNVSAREVEEYVNLMK